jgi:hypothetical protein
MEIVSRFVNYRLAALSAALIDMLHEGTGGVKLNLHGTEKRERDTHRRHKLEFRQLKMTAARR